MRYLFIVLILTIKVFYTPVTQALYLLQLYQLLIMARMMRGDWDIVVEETYEVAKELVGRSIAFDRILSRCLGVLANYQVNLILPRNHFFEQTNPI